MKNWIKENWFKVFIAITIIGLGYIVWVRQVLVRKHCATTAYSSKGLSALSGVQYNNEQREVIYKLCLRKYGL